MDEKRNPAEIVANAKQMLAVNAQQYTRATLPGWLPGQDSKHDRLYKVFGLPEELTFQAKYFLYARDSGFVKGAIDKINAKVWQDNPEIVEGSGEESKDRKETATEKEFAAFAKRTKLWRLFAMADKYRMIGNYSALILRIADGKELSEPAENIKPDDIVGYYPVWEDQLTVSDTNKDRASRDFGEPLMWSFKESNTLDKTNNTRNALSGQTIHASRVFYLGDVFTDGLSAESGNNMLSAAYNSAKALFKLNQSGAEGFAKNSMRQIHANFDKEAKIREIERDLKLQPGESIADYFRGMGEDLNKYLDAFVVTQGVDITALSVSMPQIAEFAQWNMNEFCAALGGIPSTELTGTLTGDRASTENGKVMAMLAGGRRNQVLNNDILDFVAFLQGLGCWPAKEFDISWPDLLVPSPLEKVQLASAMADANSKSLTGAGLLFDSNEMRVAGGYEPDSDTDLQKEVDGMIKEDAIDAVK